MLTVPRPPASLTAAASFAVFVAWRMLGGVAIGFASNLSPMYIAEIAPARLRGQLVTINNLAIVAGSFVAILVAYGLARSNLAGSWRWMFASQIVPVLGLMAGLCFVPNSPRWLAQAGRFSEASEILVRVYGAGPAAIGAILGSAIPLARALTEPWQYAILGSAAMLLLVLKRGVVLTLLLAAAAGIILAAAGAALPR